VPVRSRAFSANDTFRGVGCLVGGPPALGRHVGVPESRPPRNPPTLDWSLRHPDYGAGAWRGNLTRKKQLQRQRGDDFPADTIVKPQARRWQGDGSYAELSGRL
jgi:hypothetical protein